MRIVDAIIEVLEESEGLTHNEVYKKIIEKNLYSFGARNPGAVVNSELRRHCEDLNFPSASPVKYFKIVGRKENKNLYGLMGENGDSQSGEVEQRVQTSTEAELLPEEKIDRTYQFYKANLKKQLLECILDCHPSFFEQLVINLLLEMGYGSDDFAGRVLGKSHDGGIDGVIYEDKLGLSKIYIQAKRYGVGNKIGRPELQAFVGAMQDVQKGVFITTSTFTKEAHKFADKQQQKSLKLIDGDLLTELMIRYGVGLEKIQTYIVYKINEDFFE